MYRPGCGVVPRMLGSRERELAEKMVLALPRIDPYLPR